MPSELTLSQSEAASLPGMRLFRSTALVASLALIFVIPMEGAVFIEGVGRLSRVVGLFAGTAWFLSVLVSGQIRRPRAFHYFVGLFVLWNILSVFWTIDLDRTIDRMQTYAQLGCMVLILWDLFDSQRAVRAGLQAYVLGSFASSLGIVFNFFHGDAFYTGRFTAAGLHVDDVGIILALSIPIAWHLATSGNHSGVLRQGLRTANFIVPAFAVMGICLSGTRAAVVAAAPALLFIGASLVRFRPAVRLGLALAIVGVFVVVFTTAPWHSIERLGTIGEEVAQGDLNGRLNLWREGFSVFLERPFLGTGAYAYRTAIESGKAAHNSLLSVLVETGLVGLALFVTCLALAFRSALKLPRWEAAFCITLLSVWLLGVSTLTWEHRKPTWLVLAFVTAIGAADWRYFTLQKDTDLSTKR